MVRDGSSVVAAVDQKARYEPRVYSSTPTWDAKLKASRLNWVEVFRAVGGGGYPRERCGGDPVAHRPGRVELRILRKQSEHVAA